MKIINFFFFLIILLAMVSCVSKKDIIYFNKDTINQENVSNNYKTIFKSGDLVQITVSSENIISSKPFNLPVVTFSASTNAVVGTPRQQNYLIDSSGYIIFPVLGKIKIGGLTREELIKLLRTKLVPDHLKNPIINIRITNFKVTVEGDVKTPGTFLIPNERITIMEALGLAGDLNISAQRNNILIIREENGRKTQHRIDLTSMKTFNSPVYYLQQNDLVYVEPNNPKVQSASYNPNYSVIISISSVLISLISILTRK